MNKNELAQSNNGKKYGWNICLNSTIIAELTHHRTEDIFWDSYELKIVTQESIDQIKKCFRLRKYLVKNKVLNYKTWPEFLHPSLDDYFEGKTNRVFIRNLSVKKESLLYKFKNIFSKKDAFPHIYTVVDYTTIPEVDNYYSLTLNREITYYSNVELISQDETIIFNLPYVFYSPSIVDRKSQYVSGMLTSGNIKNLSVKIKFRIERTT